MKTGNNQAISTIWEDNADGVPVPKPVFQDLSASDMINQGKRLLGEEFIGYWDPAKQEYVHCPEFHGKPHLEVIWRQLITQAANGDITAIKEVFDRFMGKPKQTTENLNVNASLEDLLSGFQEPERPKDLPDLTPIEVNVPEGMEDLI